MYIINMERGRDEMDFEIYVINLEKDKERMDNITKLLTDIPFTRIDAIYGNDLSLSVECCTDYNISLFAKYFTPKSAIGCCLSHIKAAKHFVSHHKKEYVLVLEDDAIFERDDLHEVNHIINIAPRDWYIIKLSNSLEFLNTITDNIFIKLSSFYTAAYLLNRSSAEKLSEMYCHYHIDVQLWFENLHTYNYMRNIFKQQYANSNNTVIYQVSSKNNVLHYYLFVKIIRLFNVELSLSHFISVLFIFILLKWSFTKLM